MLRITPRFALTFGGLLVAATAYSPDAWARQAVQFHSASMNTYLGGVSAGQGIRPNVAQRATGGDGGATGSGLGMALFCNPFGEVTDCNRRLGPDIYFASGAYQPTTTLSSLPAQVPWNIGITYNGRQESGGAWMASDGPAGFNWQVSYPELVYSSTDGIVNVLDGVGGYFQYELASGGIFEGRNGACGALHGPVASAMSGGVPEILTLYDHRGWQYLFFGAQNTGVAAWQIWKIVDPAGNMAYVGDPTNAATAITNGFNADSSIKVAYNSANQRFTHTYSASNIGGRKRLEEVKVEVQVGGSWTSTKVIQLLTFTYYTSTIQDVGSEGDLRTVRVRTRLTDSGTTLVDTTPPSYKDEETLFWYYTRAYDNSSGRRGNQHQLKMVIGAEGTRKFDWTDSVADGDHLNVVASNEGDLKPYSTSYVEYLGDTSSSASNSRIASIFLNGDCGCSGGANGTYTFSYDNSPNYSTYTGNGTYDNDWLVRVVCGAPESAYWDTRYYDEFFQPLGRVITDAAPSGSYTKKWATAVVRNSSAQVTEVHSPANNDTYTHDSSGTPSGAFTHKASAGLVTIIDRVASGALQGLPEAQRYMEGSSPSRSTATYVSYTSYTTRTFTSAAGDVVVRPLVDARRMYHTATSTVSDTSKYDETSLGYTFHSSTDSDVLYLAVKKLTTTNPVVLTTNNGSGSATGSETYFRSDGTVAFTMAPDGIYSYTRFSNRQLVKRIDDAKTNSATDFASGDDPSTNFGISESGDGVARITQYSYDEAGRPDVITQPDGLLSKSYYSRLKDGRLATIRFPRVEATPRYYGPASYTITNLAGRADFSGLIAITSAGLTDALTGWIDENDADPVTALDKGTLARMQTTLHNNPGTRPTESRSYFLLPSSGVGSSGTNYDATTYSYDGNGRRTKTVDPTGTIDAVVYDPLSRVTQRSTGTDDSVSTSNMVVVEKMIYDDTNDDGVAEGDGNSHLSRRVAIADETDDVGDAYDNDRITKFYYNFRGHTIAVANPQSPHTVNAFDNLGRVTATAQYSSTSGLTTNVPTSTATNRLALQQQFYDAMGRVWKSQRHNIDQSDGSDDDNLQTLTWLDAAGRTKKVQGENFSKFSYDRLGRRTHAFTIADSNDTTYANAQDVAGDKVLEQLQTVYASTNSDDGVMTVAIQRHPGDTGTGALDSNADSDDMEVTAANVTGRVSISASWFDAIHRVTGTAFYGTNGIVGDGSTSTGTYDRAAISSIPTRSDTILVTTMSYNDDGSVLDVTDPLAKAQRTLYDGLGRRIADIANYTGTATPTDRDHDVYTRYDYSQGLMVAMRTDLDADNTVDTVDPVDQRTRYIFGVPKGTGDTQSRIASNRLLRAVVYPDSSNTATTSADITTSDADVVSYAYNAQGEQIYKKDHAGNVFKMDLDSGARLVNERLATVISGYDDGVRRRTLTYSDRSNVEYATQYDDPDEGQGTALDQVKTTYDGWFNMLTFQQDPDSSIGTSGRAAYDVQYAYFKSAPSGGRAAVRRSGMTMPGGATLTYNYGDGINDLYSRVQEIKMSDVTLASYTYLGAANVVGREFPEPHMLYNVHSTTLGSYPGLDQFGRRIKDVWAKDQSTDIPVSDVTITYDRGSNITRTIDAIHRNANAGNHRFDRAATLNGRNQLTGLREGHWDGSAITTGNRLREELWSINQAGAITLNTTDNNGDGDGADVGAGEITDARTFNKVNELTARDADNSSGTGADNYTPGYDATGNLTDDDTRTPTGTYTFGHVYKYDPWGRLTKIYQQDGSTLVAAYRYSALGFLIEEHADVTRSGGGAPDGTVDSNDPKYSYAYSEDWKKQATYRGSDSAPKARYVNDSAGLNGLGGSSPMNRVVLQDVDTSNGGWTGASTGDYSRREYLLQDYQESVSVVATSTGRIREWVKYSAYGVPYLIPYSDVNSDGIVNSQDFFDFLSVNNGSYAYDVRCDANLNGNATESQDYFDFLTDYYSTHPAGRGELSRSDVYNRKGFTGHESINAENRHLGARRRVMDTLTATWMSRDPLEYIDGPSLYTYCTDRPIVITDPLGLGPESTDPNAPNDPHWRCRPPGRTPTAPPPSPPPPPPPPPQPKRYDPPGRGIWAYTNCYSCAFDAAELAEQAGGTDKFKHCLASCIMAKKCGAICAELAGFFKEMLHDIPYAFWHRIPIDGLKDSWFDLRANQACIPTESFIPGLNWIGSLLRESCEDCCRRKEKQGAF